MVITERQRSDLHAGIYEYLMAQDGKFFEEAADALAEADPSCVRNKQVVDPTAPDDASTVATTSTKFSRMTTASSMSRSSLLPILERKWVTVPRLQRKVLELEKALAANAKLYARGGGGSRTGSSASVSSASVVTLPESIERRMLPRQPQTHSLPGHAATITCLAIHPTFTICASGSEDSTIKIWDHESGEYQKTLKGHTNTVRSVAFTPTGKYLASASSDLSIKLWDVVNYTCVRTLRAHDHTISAVQFIPASLEYMAKNRKTINTGIKTASGENTQTLTGIDASSAGASFLVSASRDKTIKFWDIETGFVAHTISDSQDWVRCLAVRQSDGEVIAAAGNELSISIYKTTGTRNKIASLIGHEHVIECLSFLNISTPAEKKDARPGSASLRNDRLKIPFPEANEYLASGGRDRSVRLWNIATQQCLNVFRGHENWVRSVILHPSGKYVISAGDDRTIRVMDLKSNRCLRTLENSHSHFVTCLAMHHTLPIMVSGSVDQNVNCWELD